MSTPTLSVRLTDTAEHRLLSILQDRDDLDAAAALEEALTVADHLDNPAEVARFARDEGPEP